MVARASLTARWSRSACLRRTWTSPTPSAASTALRPTPPRSPPPRSPTWWQTASGSSTPGDLSAYRTRDLPSNYLTKLNTGFANLRKQGLKAVVRFAYNYPETESDYLNAQDATPRASSAITQLQPVLQANADVIAAVQGGFIGAWGEWHTSSNKAHHPGQQGGRARCVAAGRARQPPAAGALPRRSGGVVSTPPTLEQLLAPSPTRCGAHWPAQRLLPWPAPTTWAPTGPARPSSLPRCAPMPSKPAPPRARGRNLCPPWRPRPA